MRIEVRNSERQLLTKVDIDPDKLAYTVTPPDRNAPSINLDWSQAFNEQGSLHRCPVCTCRELYVRKNFPHAMGLATVVVAAVSAVCMFAFRQIIWGLAVLGGVALIDAMIYPFSKRCLVCYRCRSEFKDLPIEVNHPGWDLSTGEKYRPVHRKTPQPPA